MKLTPLDIRRNEFTRSLRGYDREEVESFLTMVADEVEGLVGENRELSRRVDEHEKALDEYRGVESTLMETLITTQKTSDTMRESSQREAEMTEREAQVRAAQRLDNARIEAERMVLDARRQAYRIIEDARQKAQSALEQARDKADETYSKARQDFVAVQQQIQSLVERRDSYVQAMKGYLKGQAEALETLGTERPPVVDPLPQSAMPETVAEGAEVLAALDRELVEFARDTSPEAPAVSDKDQIDAPKDGDKKGAKPAAKQDAATDSEVLVTSGRRGKSGRKG
jgi:cell division initiation protein